MEQKQNKQNIYVKVARSLPLEPLPYELLEKVAREHNLDPVLLFLIHNDLLLKKYAKEV